VIDTSGELETVDIREGVVCNRAKLDYPSVGAWILDRVNPAPGLTPDLIPQLLLQDELTSALKGLAARRGALEFETLEPNPLMHGDRVVDLVLTQKNRARDLIEQFMVLTNSAVSRFLQTHGLAQIERIVHTPERWPKIVDVARSFGVRLPTEPDARALQAFLTRRRREEPELFPDLSLRVVKLLGPGEYAVVGPKDDRSGHFGLALHEYTHSTAPNRRFPDLVTQRLVKAALRGEPSPYNRSNLERIATQCTERAKQAGKVERLMRKVAAAALLEDHIDESFEAIVTGASHKGVYARIKHPPAEGRIVRGERGLEVGDCIRVRLIGLDVERGYIDFATVRMA
jgi:exoribonuclease-2